MSRRAKLPLRPQQIQQLINESDEEFSDFSDHSDYEDNPALGDFATESDDGIDDQSSDEVTDRPISASKKQKTNIFFNWKDIGDAVGKDKVPETFTGVNKVTFDHNSKTMFDIFREVFPDKIFELMVTETNAYAENFMANSQLKPCSRYKKWYITTVEEMKAFLGLLLLMGIIHKPSINSYWSTDDYLVTPIFSAIMKRDCFCNIFRFWHFSEESQWGDSRLKKIHSLLDLLQESLDEKYQPSQNLSLDESLLLWKGRLVFRQYIKSKRSKFGIKIFKLVDSNGVTLRYQIYTGEMDMIDDFSKTESVVVKMMKDFYGKGHHVFTDNYYTTPKLYTFLKEKKTSATGTIRNNRKGLPLELRKVKIAKGKKHAFETDDLLTLLFCDKRNVYMLSNAHSNLEEKESRRSKQGPIQVSIPSCISDYNKKMGYVDKTDQVLHYYATSRKTIRWYKKLALHLLQVRVLDALGIYNFIKGRKETYFDFCMNIIKQLTATEVDLKKSVVPRLLGKHFVEFVTSEKNGNPTKRCRVCYLHGIRKQSRYQCKTCTEKPGLCVIPCFERYHTEMNF